MDNKTLRFGFNTIYVIESLKPNDKKTGQIIYNDLIRWRSQPKDIIKSQIFVVNTKAEFLSAFKKISKKIPHKFLPFIHLEVHGNKNGIELGSGEFMSWEELGNEARKINIETRNNLVVTLATCFGAFFIKSIEATKKEAPFAACVASTDILVTAEIEVDFYNLFDVILGNTDFNLAVDRLNGANRVKYQFISSEEFFDAIHKGLEDELANKEGEAYKSWLNNLTDKAIKKGVLKSNQTIEELQEELKYALEATKEKVKAEHRKEFLMR